MRYAGATEKQLQLVLQAVKMSQAAKALASSLAATVAASQTADQQQQLPGSDEQHHTDRRQPLQPFPKVFLRFSNAFKFTLAISCNLPLNCVLVYKWSE